jgi:hypothetical protein
MSTDTDTATTDITGVTKTLEALQAEYDALEAKRAARAKPTEDDLRKALLQKLDDAKALDTAEEKFGKDAIATFDTGEGVVIVRRPDPLVHRKYMASVTRLADSKSEADAAKLADAAERYVIACLVHPIKGVFSTLSDKFPAMPILAAGLCSDLAAGRTRTTSEK